MTDLMRMVRMFQEIRKPVEFLNPLEEFIIDTVFGSPAEEEVVPEGAEEESDPGYFVLRCIHPHRELYVSTDVERDEDGRVLWKSLSEASKYLEKTGRFVPSLPLLYRIFHTVGESSDPDLISWRDRVTQASLLINTSFESSSFLVHYSNRYNPNNVCCESVQSCRSNAFLVSALTRYRSKFYPDVAPKARLFLHDSCLHVNNSFPQFLRAYPDGDVRPILGDNPAPFFGASTSLPEVSSG